MKAISVGQPLDGRNLFLCDRTHARDARALRLSVDQNRAGPTLAFPTSIFAAGQIQMLAQDSQKGGLGIHVNGVRFPVNGEMNRRHSRLQNEGTAVEDVFEDSLVK